ncbi:hypothetical protein [Gordonia otitidis]|uniref:hypothetical protein n=1 Tax=Gordonia otitidis TaxID=249058 RepID=UPI0002F910A8|nr:hypothetical protein [Gordonia otitidis]
MTDHDITIRKAREWRKHSQGRQGYQHVSALLAVIEQQQAVAEWLLAERAHERDLKSMEIENLKKQVTGLENVVKSFMRQVDRDQETIKDLRVTEERQAEALRQVRELAEDVKGCPAKYGYGKLTSISGWDAAMDQVMIRLDFPDGASRILDAGGEG